MNKVERITLLTMVLDFQIKFNLISHILKTTSKIETLAPAEVEAIKIKLQ